MSFLIRITSICLLMLTLVGCSAKPNLITKTEIVEVNIPVVYNLKRPERPTYTQKDTTPTYILKLLTYIKSLEIIIDEHSSDSSKGN